jgi:hypothetical protein
MDDTELAFFDEFCERVRNDGCDLPMAADLIHEMHLALSESRAINPKYQPLLDQFLAAHDVLNIQQIEWFPKVK